MPTYRNNTDYTINYENKGKLYSFPPHKEYPAKFWVPYRELGLELVSADYPPVPDSILLSGTFRFDYEIERRFNFERCNKYRLNIELQEGRVRLYTGSSRVGAEINTDYDVVLDWEKAPYIRVVGLDGKNVVRIHVEVVEE